MLGTMDLWLRFAISEGVPPVTKVHHGKILAHPLHMAETLLSCVQMSQKAKLSLHYQSKLFYTVLPKEKYINKVINQFIK